MRVHQHHLVAQTRQTVGAGQAGRAGADHGDALAAGGGAGEQGLAGVGHQVVGGVALQLADFYGLVLLGVAHAGLFAEHFGGADAGAHAAQRVGFQNGVGRAAQVAVGNALDKAGHINAGGAGALAGRVVTVITAVGLDAGLRQVHGRVGIAKIARQFRAAKASGGDAGGGAVCVHSGGSGCRFSIRCRASGLLNLKLCAIACI